MGESSALIVFAGAPLTLDFLRLDFVEVVLTNFHDFRVTTKKIDVDWHHRMFLWIDHNIIDPVFTEQARGVR
jgi:hypothetical protein